MQKAVKFFQEKLLLFSDMFDLQVVLTAFTMVALIKMVFTSNSLKSMSAHGCSYMNHEIQICVYQT